MVALVASMLSKRRMLRDTRRRTRELSGLYDTAIATTSVLETDALLRHLYEQVSLLLGPDTFVVAFGRPGEAELSVAFVMEQDRPLPPFRVALSSGGLTGWVVRHGHSLRIRDLLLEALPVPTVHITSPARSWLGVPLSARNELIGAISVQSFRPGRCARQCPAFRGKPESARGIADCRKHPAQPGHGRRSEQRFSARRLGAEGIDSL
ncbi:MAG: GAF domain-containing protein [Chloroflexi bacterium]|nr:MAG: GAF domain-containing protein [Chloroflexota bacterium]